MRMKQKEMKQKFGSLQAICSADMSLDWNKKHKSTLFFFFFFYDLINRIQKYGENSCVVLIGN